MHFFLLYTVSALLITWAIAQTASGNWVCVPSTGITDLPACDNLYTTWQTCNATATDQEYRECLCKQTVIDDSVNCESQARLCYESDAYDATISEILTNWHSVCDSYISFSPTSPVLSSLTTTFVLPASSNTAYCDNVAQNACQDFSISEAACLQINTAATGSEFLSCACQVPLLSLASVCLYDAAITCFSQSTAALSNVPLFGICGSVYSEGALVTGADASTTASPTLSTHAPSATPSAAGASMPTRTSASMVSATTASSISQSTATSQGSVLLLHEEIFLLTVLVILVV